MSDREADWYLGHAPVAAEYGQLLEQAVEFIEGDQFVTITWQDGSDPGVVVGYELGEEALDGWWAALHRIAAGGFDVLEHLHQCAAACSQIEAAGSGDPFRGIVRLGLNR